MIKPISKPPPREKKPRKPLRRTPMARGGRKPKEAGRRYERDFSNKYGFQRQVGSGAFGKLDPMLVGDVAGAIGKLKFLFELKSLEQYNGRGERTVSFPKAWLDKINLEAKSVGRLPVFIYHLKGAPEEWAVIRYDVLYAILTELEEQIAALEEQLQECLSE